MKKLLLVLTTLFLVAGSVFADNETDEIRLDMPVTNIEDNTGLENESNGKSNLDELF